MDTRALKTFAQRTRLTLMAQVAARLDVVLATDSPARRESPAAVRELEQQLQAIGKAQLIEQVAYTWFNRFCALRYMDVRGYTDLAVVSPSPDQTRPEILAEAMAGVLPDYLDARQAEAIQALLDGRAPSREPQAEAYRQLVVASCNHWHRVMPFLFERIADYTELLMPPDLLAADGWLSEMRAVMTEEACQEVEIIGWLYQFYISEKKDEVFAGLKKNQKITAENIPAATQLFTPHWIVRYLVENSLGRLWLLNRPNSRLAERMDYYIPPVAEEVASDQGRVASEEETGHWPLTTSHLRISSPEEIRICDPACGSGHMLTYAFDLLHAIYEEEGYDPTEIPALILTHNLTGVEIDDRAGALAAFALAMKAADRLGRRRFLRMTARPDICVLQNVQFTPEEMRDIEAVVGEDLFTDELRETLGQFEEAKNFGSLIVPKLRDPAETLRVVEARDFGSDLLLKEVQERVVTVLRMAEALAPKYHVVVANPPYMGGKGMNSAVADYLKTHYSDVKSDLFSAFIIRNTELAVHKGQLGFMTPFTWMFISSYEKLRRQLLERKAITSLVQLEYSGFDGATVPICTFTLENARHQNLEGGYIRLSDFRGAANQAPRTLEAVRNSNCGWFYRATSKDFLAISGSPIAYWLSPAMRATFKTMPPLDETLTITGGMTTGENERWVREWHEVSQKKFTSSARSREEAVSSRKKWFPYNKGGSYRKWFGNRENVVNWKNDGAEIIASGRAFPRSKNYYFQESLTYTATSSSYFGVRYSDPGFVFDAKGSSCFSKSEDLKPALGFLCSKISSHLLKGINPTIEFQTGNLSVLPFERPKTGFDGWDKLIKLSRSDWDAYETSWDFTTLPLLSPEHRGETLEDTYARLRAHWQAMTDEMQRLEEENNRIFIDAYGLQDELTPEVPIEEITLTCNPAYRYGIKGSEEDRETRLRADTMAEFISYAVGCMFGRYSLDAPGLILANQGETLADFVRKVASGQRPVASKEGENYAGLDVKTSHWPLDTSHLSFLPDADNVIPVLDADWFPDDITERFRKFLRVTFGEAHFQENLRFIEQALGKDIRKYFTKDFYTDHVKRYKKRPIYWLFRSPKGAFQALIYMHRYNQDTVSVVLNNYLREFRNKLEAHRRAQESIQRNASATPGEKTRALKEIERTNKSLTEIDAWERDVLYPLATERLTIDLDDGVKQNYPKFGEALKAIPGL